MVDLLSVQEAQIKLLAGINTVGIETVELSKLAGRTLAENIASDMDAPPFTNSGMDGFAVRAVDTNLASPDFPITLKVTIDIPAGIAPTADILSGQAARIMTGAPLPNGADSVIPVELTNLPRPSWNTPRSDAQSDRGMDQTLPNYVQLHHPAKVGDNVRTKGQDLKTGAVVLQRGRKLQPQDLGLLASLGKAQVPVYCRPRIALLTSGSELVFPHQPLEPGKIRDSNTAMLSALIEKNGAQVILLGIASDDAAIVRERLNWAVHEKVDMIVTSAGVSVGAFDYVRTVIEESGQLNFWRVNMRPGKPIAFGYFQNTPLIGLPGNPVSAFVGCTLFVLPALNKLAGLPALKQRSVRVHTCQPIQSDGRESYLRVTIKADHGKLLAELSGHQGSGNLYALVKADALLIIPAGVTQVEADKELEAIIINDYS